LPAGTSSSHCRRWRGGTGHEQRAASSSTGTTAAAPGCRISPAARRPEGGSSPDAQIDAAAEDRLAERRAPSVTIVRHARHSSTPVAAGRLRVPEPTWIATAGELARRRALDALDEIALDTEFVFERTFRPQLGLVQLATADEIALIDPVALPDLGAGTLLQAPQPRAGPRRRRRRRRAAARRRRPPRPLLDTQVAAAFGPRSALSYAALVEALTGVALGKHETRTDWLRRPLAREQLRYAAEDVEHLPAVAAELERRLTGLGRLAWALEDSEAMAEGVEGSSPRMPGGGSRGSSGCRRACAWWRALAAWRGASRAPRPARLPAARRDPGGAGPAATLTARDAVRLPGYDARRHAPTSRRGRPRRAGARGGGGRGRSGARRGTGCRSTGLGAGGDSAVVARRRALELSPELLLAPAARPPDRAGTAAPPRRASAASGASCSARALTRSAPASLPHVEAGDSKGA
jgi:hypothetical protein